MAQEHDNVETAAEDGEPVALDGQVEQPATEDEGTAEQDEPEQDEDETEAVQVARPGRFEPRDPTMLMGEARDHVLGAIRRSPFWGKLGEKQQRSLANEVEQAQRQAIRGIYRVTAAMDLDVIEVTIKDPSLKSDKEQIEAKIIIADDENAWMRLREQNKCTLVFANVGTLLNARAAEVMKDAPGLFDMAETPEQRATREAIDAEAAAHEAKERKAAEQARLLEQFKPTGDAEPGQGEVAPDAAPTAAQAEQVASAAAEGRTVDEETGEVYHGDAKPPARRRARQKRETADA